jgi:copper transport protein
MIKKKFLAKQGIFPGILIAGITLLIIISDNSSFSESYSQIGTFEESFSLTPQTETVTSYYDALLKVPLIVSQTAIVGVVFSHIFFQRIVRNRTQLSHRDNSSKEMIDDDNICLRSIKRLFMILLSCGISMVFSATSLFLLQASSLSTELGMDMNTTFTILSSTPVGPVWNIRVTTSLIIITSSILYYIFEKRDHRKKHQKSLENSESSALKLSKKTRRKGSLHFQNIILYIMMLAGAVSIFSNSMISHNTALSFLPSLAISLDWFHFMAVAIWLGGLFYITLILLMTIKQSIRKNGKIDGTVNKSPDVNAVHDTSYFLVLLLPYFSLIATISLGIIGVTGLYMAWIHLHTAEAIFTSSYGNILSIKLLLILPMVILGGYHQIKLHGRLMAVASLGKGRHKQQGAKINAYNMESSNDCKESPFSLQFDPSRKFSKTIKIESFIGIGVLVAASFLTITSPPSISLQESTSNQCLAGEESQQDYIPSLDSFTILAIILSVAVIFGSITYFKRSKQQVRSTIAHFEDISDR